MRFFTALIALAVASVELGVLAAPAAQPNVNGLSVVSKNAGKPKAARVVPNKTAKRRARRATVNSPVPAPVASQDTTAAPVKAISDATDEQVTVIVHKLADDGEDGDDDDDDAGDANAGDDDDDDDDDADNDDDADDDDDADNDEDSVDVEAREAGDDQDGDDDNDHDADGGDDP